MHPLNTSKDFNALLADADDRPVVMLGEASHGTHEYYTWRTALSKRLIEEKGFRFIAVEGDWPDCYKINRYVKGYPDAGDSIHAVLRSFDRWPTWMWANWEVAALAEWLRDWNSHRPMEQRVGFYGLDVYSLWDSMRILQEYLEGEDPALAKAIRGALGCFQPYEDNEHAYARASLTKHSCRDRVLELLREVREKALQYSEDAEAAFSAEQNALIAVNAESYYRSMMSFDNESWNVRDRHMMETLRRLMDFHGPEAKGIVWEHNTHIGDARATSMRQAGMINIGQLAREEYGLNRVYLCGFGCYEGSVVAGEEWGAPHEVMPVPEAREGSIEHWLHRESTQSRYLLFNTEDIRALYDQSVQHRAIGVVYDPDRERYGNYVPTVMAERYDAFIFIDRTEALHPLHTHDAANKIPDTYPFGL
ncbi:erythromycin esterase family protein [Flaviaesturariibacter aridisoli]|uniref:Erythromycin esterase family protein n=1 Tax=Flaviaesturariibacter aridisoli TaxID=2545761 RepID=A0A4R4DXV2_9BACT|nr:erythromycin esterase family protein [Flaviaesturariibacter aridisoli]TCZ68269.1 erythromycin esterase family protein [Flaviaesturariibacter aridisoli]